MSTVVKVLECYNACVYPAEPQKKNFAVVESIDGTKRKSNVELPLGLFSDIKKGSILQVKCNDFDTICSKWNKTIIENRIVKQNN